MDGKQFLLATVLGAITLFALGGLVFALALAGFFEANSTSAMRDAPLFGWIALGQLILAALLTLVLGSWARVSSAGDGLKKGLLFGLLMAGGYDLTLYGTSDLMNLPATVVDVLGVALLVGAAGAVIGAILSRSSSQASASI